VELKSFAFMVGLVFVAGQLPAQVPLVIANHSFEADAVTASPGYRTTLTGWTPTGQFGTNTAGMPFMDNGVVPDGTRVLFIQHAGSVSQTVSGFLANQGYTFKVRVNSRASSPPDAILRLSVNGNVIYGPTAVVEVGGTNPFTLISKNFLNATAGAFDIKIENTNPAPTDNTLLVDQIEIVPAPASASDWQHLK
jgi:hypothetical protein